MDRGDLAPYFAEMARRLVAIDGVQETMTAIVHAAVEITECDHCSLSYLRGDDLVSASSNDRIGPLLDAIQTETQEGPCLDAIRERRIIVVDDLERSQKFTVYGPRAATETGVRSSMATNLTDGRRTIGALNLFSEDLGSFSGDSEQEARIAVLAAHAAPALAAALHRANMEQALRSRDLIGQAKGMLMARANVDEDKAFQLLVEASQRTNTKLIDVAKRLIAGTLEDSSA
jgi:GAF domain-containing protein